MNATEGIQYLKSKSPVMPVFCILASDPDGAKIVREWACRRMVRSDPKGKATQAFEIADQMEVWRMIQKGII